METFEETGIAFSESWRGCPDDDGGKRDWPALKHLTSVIPSVRRQDRRRHANTAVVPEPSHFG